MMLTRLGSAIRKPELESSSLLHRRELVHGNRRQLKLRAHPSCLPAVRVRPCRTLDGK